MCFTTDNNHKPEDKCRPAFWSSVTPQDVAVLKGQNRGRRFSVENVIAVAKRCRHGYPQILLCKPLSGAMEPFPTIFWMTCPYLDKRCGELESEHKIHDLEELLAAKEDEIKKFHMEYIDLRMSFISEREKDILTTKYPKLKEKLLKVGIGGINWHEAPFAAKCLHLQVATWLGCGRHPAGDWLRLELGETVCRDSKCDAYLADAED